jgi:2,3-bisphosphoglycerate-independent phosphoglycerate mutase
VSILFLFLDGVGLGAPDPATNPFVTAELPTLRALVGGQGLVAGTPATETERALFIPTDAGLGVAGLPQSATGQATLLTGQNVPRANGGHWGPKPNLAIAALLRSDNVFLRLRQRGRSAALLNAYPQRYFDAIDSGRRNYSAVPLAVTSAGLRLFATADLRAGRALSADFTAEGWPEGEAPRYSPRAAGQKLAELAGGYDFAFFEFWLSDYIGHRGSLDEACGMLERLDAVLAGLLAAWDHAAGLIIITADHGNLEDLSHRHHTPNRVPTFLIGRGRHAFGEGLTDLTHFTPAILEALA